MIVVMLDAGQCMVTVKGIGTAGSGTTPRTSLAALKRAAHGLACLCSQREALLVVGGKKDDSLMSARR